MRRIAIVTLLLVIWIPTSARSEVFRRLEVSRTITGVIELREATDVEFSQPVRAPGGDSVTSRESPVSRAWSIDLIAVSGDERALGETGRRGMGTVHIVLDASLSDQDDFSALVRRKIERLQPDAFTAPFAGLDRQSWLVDPVTIGSIARQPAWVCFEQGTMERSIRIHAEPGEAPTAEIVRSAAASSACRSARRATAGLEPETLRTMPGILSARDITALVTHLDLLDPDHAGVTYPSPPSDSWDLSGSRNRPAAESEPPSPPDVLPARIPVAAVRDNSFIARIGIDVEKIFYGPGRDKVPVKRADVIVILLPVDIATLEPGTTVDDDRPAPRFDFDKHVDGLARALQTAGPLDGGELGRTAGRVLDGISSSAWVHVLCESNGEATWSSPPFSRRARVINGGEICAEAAAVVPLPQQRR